MTVAFVLHCAGGAPVSTSFRTAPLGWESSDRVAKFYVVQSAQA